MNPICQFCAHYEPLENDIGECRERPPVIVFHQRLLSLQEVTVFPKVKRNQWCGKHKEKDECQTTDKK